MGSSQSKQSFPKQRHPSKLHSVRSNFSQRRGIKRRKSSSFREIVKDINTFLRTSDTTTIRRYVGNYFLITSTKKRIEFAHGVKDDRQKLKWVTEEDFRFSTLLGKGGFGVVYKARRKSTGRDYALKIQPMEVMARSTRNVGKKEEDETLIHMERTVLASCRGHPFIVKLEYAFHTKMYAILGLEYVPGGTLSSLISNSPERRLSFQLAKLYVIEMIIALQFMHTKGIIYRDLKPSNVLVTLNGHLKLTDFGLAGAIVRYSKKKCDSLTPSKVALDSDLAATISNGRHDEPTCSTDEVLSESSSPEPEMSDHELRKVKNVKWVRRRTVCGTAGYRPPEQVQERFLDYFSRSGYDERADWFSLGVCCFTLLTGHRPFPTKRELMKSDSQRNLPPYLGVDKIPDNINVQAVKRLMNDIEYRCLMFEVEFPPYFEVELKAKHFIEALLARNPDERPRYDDIISHPWMTGESFNAEEISKLPVPQWVKDHAQLQSVKNENPRRTSLRCRNHINQRSLSECIESLCSDCFEKHETAYAENFAMKWSTSPERRTFELFRHWNFMSDDIIELETKISTPQERSSKNQTLSEKIHGIFHSNQQVSSIYR